MFGHTNGERRQEQAKKRRVCWYGGEGVSPYQRTLLFLAFVEPYCLAATAEMLAFHAY